MNVRCTRCRRVYECTPYDDHYTPNDTLPWEGKVCFECLLELSVMAVPDKGETIPEVYPRATA